MQFCNYYRVESKYKFKIIYCKKSVKIIFFYKTEKIKI